MKNKRKFIIILSTILLSISTISGVGAGVGVYLNNKNKQTIPSKEPIIPIVPNNPQTPILPKPNPLPARPSIDPEITILPPAKNPNKESPKPDSDEKKEDNKISNPDPNTPPIDSEDTELPSDDKGSDPDERQEKIKDPESDKESQDESQDASKEDPSQPTINPEKIQEPKETQKPEEIEIPSNDAPVDDNSSEQVNDENFAPVLTNIKYALQHNLALITLNFDKSSLENHTNKKLVFVYKKTTPDQKLNPITIVYNNQLPESILLRLSSLEANTSYEIESISLGGKDLALDNLTTTFQTPVENPQANDDFTISNITFDNITDTSASVNVEFSNITLRDIENKNFKLELQEINFVKVFAQTSFDDGDDENSIQNQNNDASSKISQNPISETLGKTITIETNDFEINNNNNNNSLIFQLNNLKLLQTYEIKKISLNDNKEKTFNSNQHRFKTLAPVITYDNAIFLPSLKDNDDGNRSDSININFENLNNMFNLEKYDDREYSLALLLKSSDNNQMYLASTQLKKESNDNLTNISISLVPNEDFARGSYVDTQKDIETLLKNNYVNNQDYLQDFFAENLIYEVKKIAIFPLNTHTFDDWIILEKNSPEQKNVINTNFGQLRYENVQYSYTNNQLNISLSFNNSNNEVLDVYVQSDLGYFQSFEINTNSSNTITISNPLENHKFSILKVVEKNGKNVRINSKNEGMKNFKIPQTTQANINSFSITNDPNKYLYSKVNVGFINHHLLNGAELDNAILTIQDRNNSSASEIKLNKFTFQNNIYQFEAFNLTPNTEYSIRKLEFPNLNKEFNFSIAATTPNVTKTNYSESEFRNKINSITQITLRKKWWSSGIQNKLFTSNTFNETKLFELTNLADQLNLSNKNVSVTFNSVSNSNEVKGTLTVNLTFSSGGTNINKSLTINNLYSYNSLKNLGNNAVDLFYNLIKAKKGTSNEEFDQAFRDKVNEDINAAFGVKTSRIELNSENKTKLLQYLDMDESFMDFDNSKIKIILWKQSDLLDRIPPAKTSEFPMLGYIHYDLEFTNLAASQAFMLKDLYSDGFNLDDKSKLLFHWLSEFTKTPYDQIKFSNKASSNTQIINEINAISDKTQKVQKLFEQDNNYLKDKFNRIVTQVKQNYAPEVRNEAFIYQLESIHEEVLGQNKFLVFQISLKTNFVLPNKTVNKQIGWENLTFRVLNNN